MQDNKKNESLFYQSLEELHSIKDSTATINENANETYLSNHGLNNVFSWDQTDCLAHKHNLPTVEGLLRSENQRLSSKVERLTQQLASAQDQLDQQGNAAFRPVSSVLTYAESNLMHCVKIASGLGGLKDEDTLPDILHPLVRTLTKTTSTISPATHNPEKIKESLSSNNCSHMTPQKIQALVDWVRPAQGGQAVSPNVEKKRKAPQPQEHQTRTKKAHKTLIEWFTPVTLAHGFRLCELASNASNHTQLKNGSNVFGRHQGAIISESSSKQLISPERLSTHQAERSKVCFWLDIFSRPEDGEKRNKADVKELMTRINRMTGYKVIEPRKIDSILSKLSTSCYDKKLHSELSRATETVCLLLHGKSFVDWELQHLCGRWCPTYSGSQDCLLTERCRCKKFREECRALAKKQEARALNKRSFSSSVGAAHSAVAQHTHGLRCRLLKKRRTN